MDFEFRRDIFLFRLKLFIDLAVYIRYIRYYYYY